MSSHPPRFGIQIPQQNTTWAEILSLWQEVDELGYDTAWTFDHFLPIFSDPTGPCLDGWTTLAALAMASKNVRIGTMVTGATYRHPAVLAKMATTVDIVSGGRLIFGIGAGWFELEHQEYGIPFHTVGRRLRRLDETLEIVRQLWSQERSNFTGKHFTLTDASFNPKPLQQPRPPILVGATGEEVALRIVAKHADMWNSFGTPEVFRTKIARLESHCRDLGRDPATIEKSVLVSRANSDGPFEITEARRQIDAFHAVGVTHIIFSVRPIEREWVRRFAREVMPAYRR
ncbi:MAG TPA: LLM class F420-dependent oxidoreductase [Candidatus Binataceae bacterium]|nr:LLM class F420-dependent oxidoreductase [Candidatus Binataceae bacterium]